jgi:hypothetical protein
MSAVERLNFVIWAGKRDPQFTLSHRAYTRARWQWRTVVRNDPSLRRVVQAAG